MAEQEQTRRGPYIMRWRRRLNALIGRHWEAESEVPTPLSGVHERARSSPEWHALAASYSRQRAQLEADFKHQGVGIFVADYALAMAEDASLFSYCVWTQGMVTLLAEASFVVMVGVASKTGECWEAIVPWPALLRVAGDACLVREAALIPPRWRAVMWPNRHMLEELRAAAVHF